jgi:O-antigen ligase
LLIWILYGILCAAVFFITRRRAIHGLGALIIATPFTVPYAVAQSTMTIPKLFVLTIAAALATRGAIELRALARNPLCIAIVCLTSATAATWVGAISHDAVARETGKMLLYFLTFAVAYWCYRRDPDHQALTIAVTVALALVVLSALVEERTGAPSVFASAHGTVARIAGPLEGPNQCAGYLDVALCWLIAQATFFRANTPPFLRSALACALFFGFIALFLTFSRGGILATSLTVMLLLTLRGAWRTTTGALWLGATVTGLSLDLALAQGGAHLFSLTDSGDTGALGHRSELWRAALWFWRAHPLLGIGAGNYERELALAGYPRLHAHANSLYLQSLAEGGLVLFTSVIALFFAIGTTFVRSFQRSPLAAGALAATLAFAAHQSVDFLVFYPKVAGLWWIILGCALASTSRDGDSALSQDCGFDPKDIRHVNLSTGPFFHHRDALH